MERQISILQQEALLKFSNCTSTAELEQIFLQYFGASGSFTRLLKDFKNIPENQRPKLGKLANMVKKELETAYSLKKEKIIKAQSEETIDVTIPGNEPPMGHLHIVTQAIEEIDRIFSQIGFTRVRYREIEWDWYSFGSLNFPPDHPARDDFETFFIDAAPLPKYGRMLLSPHTSSGQVREMERMHSRPPIRMINIAKCYRPNWDISHTPMFHQFEGLVVDEGINITHLKGTMDYFAKQYFGPERKTRLRPFHFQFTEPSFEVDITCGVCLGKGTLPDGQKCKYCKEGWLELGGSGMVHPNVLAAGKIDPKKYTGFAFGWGVERTYMMKSGTKLDDNRLLYTNDIRFLEQF
ncbi:phenylalanine--tRNA ligase subunit alpha [Patescibacteria group bacterium]|nr:phenylalanine--tRNA ligase subunit alpha [Patescibacteria group bacterium]MCL5797461.1 phenylalanine--tRNA ligase subunit alpha [Patescibacteria group bacterium]